MSDGTYWITYVELGGDVNINSALMSISSYICDNSDIETF